MNKFRTIVLLLLTVTLVMSSCDDILDADSQRLTAEEDYRLATPSDSVYSIFGILSQLQKVADGYVLLGELRADLMEVDPDAEKDLLDIYNHTIRKDNKYANIRNYYSIINNCNYMLNYLDTAKVERGELLSRKHYAAVQAIRAWTYMQIVLNFKTAKYYSKPILSVKDAEMNFPELTMEALADSLIPILEPLRSIPTPNIGYIDAYNTDYSFFPVQFVLGDLYLWKGEYQKAAEQYRDLMYTNSIAINKEYSSSWTSVNNTISSSGTLNWINSLLINSGEVITAITCPTEYGQDYTLDTLNNHKKIRPTALAIHNWDSPVYYLNEASNTNGDLRKYGSISYSEETARQFSSDFNFDNNPPSDYIIYKYKIYQQNVTIYRSALLYLRYAEAINRMNKPNTAFAVLKHGLNSTTMFNASVVPASERDVPLAEYMNFADMRFQNNVGIRMRGLGNMDKDTTFYRLPKQATLLDSVRMVEDLIQQELALETAFEGNRYHDLMRITLRRMKDGDDASYLAEKVAAKYNDPARMKNFLMNPDNWYIK
ncbi:MAG: RagB/SusD family nutrient uptake outer membrane protein [Paludibacter sp.]|nr:RagB/SusD family nutrient uptake outer membrane protein [Paludibacter sp.]